MTPPGEAPPKIQALGTTQEGSPTRWRATGHVEALRALAAERDGPPPLHARGDAHV
jgi:hypothetical protein